MHARRPATRRLKPNAGVAANGPNSSVEPFGLDSIYVAPVGQARRVLLLVHGLTGGRDQAGNFVEVANAAAENGYASLRFDMRGRGDSPGYLTLETMIEDVKAAADWLGRRHSGLPGTVVARGEGAYAALAALAPMGERWSTMIFWAAILFPRTSREIQGGFHSYRERGYEDLEAGGRTFRFDEQFYAALDRIPSVHDCTHPGMTMTFIHSENDGIAKPGLIADFQRRHPNLAIEVKLIGSAPDHMHLHGQYVADYRQGTIERL